MVGRGVWVAAMVAAMATTAAQPNVVLILADDLGYGDIGANGGKAVATPHIDALARRGVRLTQGYVSHPVCSPSRAGLVTGRYQQRHGWEFNPAGRDRAAGMSTDELTVADAMRGAGYRTGLIGKWHLGSQPRHHPVNRGFDEFFGMVEGGSIYIDAICLASSRGARRASAVQTRSSAASTRKSQSRATSPTALPPRPWRLSNAMPVRRSSFS